MGIVGDGNVFEYRSLVEGTVDAAFCPPILIALGKP
jgi:hypothetical protein